MRLSGASHVEDSRRPQGSGSWKNQEPLEVGRLGGNGKGGCPGTTRKNALGHLAASLGTRGVHRSGGHHLGFRRFSAAPAASR